MALGSHPLYRSLESVRRRTRKKPDFGGGENQDTEKKTSKKWGQVILYEAKIRAGRDPLLSGPTGWERGRERLRCLLCKHKGSPIKTGT